MTTNLDVLFDVDGVLYPLPELFTPYAAERLGRDLSSTRRTGSSTRSGASATTTSSNCSARASANASCGGPARRTPTSCRRSSGSAPAGHRIHVVTARDVSGIEAEALDATGHWLDRHGIEVDTITLAQDKTIVIDAARARPVVVRGRRRRPAPHRGVREHRRVRDRARSLGQLPRRLSGGRRPRRGRRPHRVGG